MKNNVLKGGLLVALGASSYGVLTTFVKMAYEKGFTTYEVTFAQLLLGVLGLTLLSSIYKGKKQKKEGETSKFKLLLAGTSLGLTSIFYYLAVQYISVSMGIVLLMQSVWIGVILDSILTKSKPSPMKIIAVLVILTGTLLATNLIFQDITFDLRGIGYGLLAACSYTVTIYTSNTVSLGLPALERSKYMVIGGLLIVSLITLPSFIVNKNFNVEVFYLWGPILALFGTILPPLFLTTGMPKLNVGLGVIITSIELPVAVLMAKFLLDESVNAWQWLGIVFILTAIVLMNLRKLNK